MSIDISTAELRRMSPDELRKEVILRKAECAKMRIGLKAQGEKNHALYRNKRREIARLLTVLRELERNRKSGKTKGIVASQATGNAVKGAGSQGAAAKSVSTKSRKSSLSS
ncbi:MAG: 50S ribosomal protein L29 [Candidatus Peribacteraceae bacterium]